MKVDLKPQKRRLELLAISIIFILGFLIYSPTFQSSFHLDDVGSIVENEEILRSSNFQTLWQRYKTRIVAYGTFVLNYRLSKLEVFSYHIVNLSVHILSGLLVYFSVLLFFETPRLKDSSLSLRKELIALFSSLIFLSHPIQTQSVTYIVQRIASLAGLFSLASLAAYLKSRLEGRIAFYLLSFFAALLAMFTKETAYTLPLAFLLTELIFFKASKNTVSQSFVRLGPFFFLWVVVYFTCYHQGLAEVPLGEMTRAGSGLSRPHYLFTQINVLRTYLRLFFFPYPQNLDYDYPISRTLFEPPTLASLGLHTILFLTAILLFKRQPLISFGILWFFLTLSVESSLIPIEDVIFEHRLYLPLFGFAMSFTSTVFVILSSFGLSEAAPLRGRPQNDGVAKTYVVLLSLLVAIFSVLTYVRNNVWRDEITLWQDVLAKSPGKVRPYDNLGAGLLEKGRLAETEALLERALEKNLSSDDTYNTLGVAIARQGRSEEAIPYYEKALGMNPEFEKAYNNFGISLTNLGRLEEAIRRFNKALQLKPDYAEAHRNMGAALAKQGKPDEALKHYSEAVRLKPDYAEAHTSMGVIFYKRGMLEEAMKHYANALRFTPTYAEAHNNMGVALADRGRLEEAVAHFSEAIRLNPNYTAARQNLEMTTETLRGRN